MRPTNRLLVSMLVGGAMSACMSACMPPVPPARPTPRQPLRVSASFARTWNTLIDVFADHNIPIRAIDRASGFVSAEPVVLSADEAVRYADCGRPGGMGGQGGGFRGEGSRASDGGYRASIGYYNVVVRGDESGATVRVTAKFTSGESPVGCESRGLFESTIESDVRRRAEGHP